MEEKRDCCDALNYGSPNAYYQSIFRPTDKGWSLLCPTLADSHNVSQNGMCATSGNLINEWYEWALGAKSFLKNGK